MKMENKQYNVGGMSCAACSARVEKAVYTLEGVEECAVSLLTNSMSVKGDVPESAVIAAVTKAGYTASVKGKETDTQNNPRNTSDETDTFDKQTHGLISRLVSSLVFLIVLMYISMGHVMWGFPLPSVLSRNPVAVAIIQLLLTVVVMIINSAFFISGFKALYRRSPNMDSLVALGSSAAFVYSLCVLFVMTDSVTNGNVTHASHLLHELYFESAAMILALITVGKALESRAKGKTANALKSLVKLAPKTAIVEKDGKEVAVEISQLKVGDIFIVKPGSSVPCDGFIVEGEISVDESALTGESIPVDKKQNDTISASTINKVGYAKCKATRVGNDTTLSQIIKLVTDAAATKAPVSRIADKVSGIFVPTVIAISLVTIIAWLIADKSVGFALARGISVLVISCPCALGLATPVAIMVGNGLGAKCGILFKNSVSLENIGKIKNIALDKTGTVTTGVMSVTDVVCADGVSVDTALSLCASCESMSEHPIAKAVVEYAKSKGTNLQNVTNFKNISGKGISAELDAKQLHIGNMDFVNLYTKVADEFVAKANELSQDGKTLLFLECDGKFICLVALSDTLKADTQEAVLQLNNQGVDVTMLTGDNEVTAKAVAKKAGIKNVIAGVLPDGKEKTVRALKQKGLCAMVGDGINDAPALAVSDVGIAIGAGTDVAIDSADVVLVKSNTLDIPACVRLGRATLRNIHQNLFWAFFYNVIGIPLAAGVLYYPFGITLNPMIAAAAMSFSSVFVVTNALRLNAFDVKNPKHDKKYNKHIKEERNMTITLKIEGMMCPHCEANVKGALEANEGVVSAEVSHKEGTAVVTVKDGVTEKELSDIVTGKGYKVL